VSQQAHWSSIKERGSLLGIRFLVAIYKVFGKGFFRVCFFPVMLYFYLTGGQARQGVLKYWRNIEKARQEPPSNSLKLQYQGFKVFLTFGWAIVDKFDAWLGKIHLADLDIVNPQSYAKLTEGGGCVILSTHLGNMEICRAIFGAGENKKKLNVITYNEHAPSFNNFLKRINPEAAINFIHIDNFGPDDTIKLKQKIEDGEAVVIFADRTSVTNPNSVHFVPFLTEPAPIAIGPFALATIMDCPVYFMTCLKNSDSNRYQVHIEDFAEPVKVRRKERQAYFQQLMRKYADRLSYYCLLAPHQWGNFFDFWRGNETLQDNSSAKDNNQ
tara:strand:- start:31191 stop:32171 length:981 start_codon:yes stop_codon:yes gene_type:complete